MSEEAANAAKAVPMGIIASIAMCCKWTSTPPPSLQPLNKRIGGLGFVIVIVLAATISDVESVLGTSFGQPMAQIYYDALGKHATLGFMSVLFSK